MIIGYVGGLNKRMLDLYKKLESQERGAREKREKNGLKLNFLSFPSLFFSLSLLSLSLSLSLSLFQVNILLYLHKRSSGDRFLVYVCFPKTRSLSSLLTTLQEAILLKFWNIFVKAILPCNGPLYFEFLWDAYSGTCDALSLLCHAPQSLLQNCTCPHRQVRATGSQPSMAASFRMKRPTHCRQWDVQVLVSVYIYRSRKIRSPTVRQCTFLQRNLVGTSSPMVGWQPCRRPPTTCSRRT